MIPVLGELLTSASWREMAAGVVLSLLGLAYLGCAALLAWIDLREHRLPNRILYPWACVTVVLLCPVAALMGDWMSLLRGLLAGLLWGLAFLLVRVMHPPSMGMGDVKLVVVLGCYVGFLGWEPVLAAVVLSFLLAGMVSVVLLAGRKVNRRTAIPFGPFLLLGSAVPVFLGT